MEKIIVEYSTGGEYEFTYHTKAFNYKSLQDAKDDFELLFWEHLKKCNEFNKKYQEAQTLLEKYNRDIQHKPTEEKRDKIYNQHQLVRELWNNKPQIFTIGEAQFNIYNFIYKKGKNEAEEYMAPSFSLLEDWYQDKVKRSTES